MHTVGKALQKIKKNSEIYSIPIDLTEDFKLGQFATLLNDISHLPFSHALDNNSTDHEEYSARYCKKIQEHYNLLI
jgi:HD superfamily phosphohydrolase